jgi:hypothetical protein
VGTDGSKIRFGDLNSDKRADYTAIMSDDTGAASEWRVGCNADGGDPGDNSPVETPGTIKQPDEFCSALDGDGGDPKTVDNWEE